MSRSPNERFDDILSAIERCRSYRTFLQSSDEQLSEMDFDATLRNLAVIGEAVRALPAETIESMPDVPWTSIAGLRNIVVHEFFRVNPELISDIVDKYLGQLQEALEGSSI